MKESRKFVGIVALMLSMVSMSAGASAILSVGDVEVIEDRYAQKVITTTVHYDGSFGDSAGLGVEAVTDEPVKRSGFSPYSLSKGSNEIQISVTRPVVDGDISSDSHSLRFQVYSYSAHDVRKEMVKYALSWPSIADYFDFGELPPTEEPYETVTSISIDESLGDIAPLVRAAHAGGIEASDITIFYSAMAPSPFSAPTEFGEQVALVVPATTSWSDLRRLAGSLSAMGVEKVEFRPVPIDAEGFELGKPMIGDPALIHGIFVETSELLSINDEDGQAALYAKAQYENYDRELTYDKLLEKAIALSERRNRSSAFEAREIAEYLIAAGYENSRVYSVLAASHCCHHKSNDDFLRARRAIHNLALSVNPKDQWIHAQLAWDEALRGDFEAAERHAQFAVEYAKEQNVWNISNYGRLYAMQGRNEEAKEKYAELRGLKNLSPFNQRAHRQGLSDYIDVLAATKDPLTAEVYDELITTYPVEAACKKLEYAGYLASTEPSTGGAEQLLTDRNVQNCRGYASVAAFVDVLNWYRNQSSDVALRKALMRHEDLGMLIYSVASVREGPEILASLAQRGVDLSTQAASGFNTLHMAVLELNRAAMQASIKAGIDIDAMSDSGYSALMLAVYVENESMARELLANGARLDIQSKHGFNVLDMVAASTNENMKSLFKRSST